MISLRAPILAAFVVGAAAFAEEPASDQPSPPSERSLPPPPLVDAPEPPPVAAPPKTTAPTPPPSLFGLRLPLLMMLGAGAGASFDSAGLAPAFELYVRGGPRGSPFWGELGLFASPLRTLPVGAFEFHWSRGATFSLSAGYRLPGTPVEVTAGALGARVSASPADEVGVPGFSQLDAGLFAGSRVAWPLGAFTGWVGARLWSWLTEHRIQIGTTLENQASVPVVGLWLGLGVAVVP